MTIQTVKWIAEEVSTTTSKAFCDMNTHAQPTESSNLKIHAAASNALQVLYPLQQGAQRPHAGTSLNASSKVDRRLRSSVGKVGWAGLSTTALSRDRTPCPKIRCRLPSIDILRRTPWRVVAGHLSFDQWRSVARLRVASQRSACFESGVLIENW